MLTARLWSLNGPLIKLASDSSSGPAGGHDGWTIAFDRSLSGGLPFVPVLHRRARRLERWASTLEGVGIVFLLCIMLGAAMSQRGGAPQAGGSCNRVGSFLSVASGSCQLGAAGALLAAAVAVCQWRRKLARLLAMRSTGGLPS